MKKLVSVLNIQRAAKDGITEIIASHNNTIITAEARDLAEKLGIKILDKFDQRKPAPGGEMDDETFLMIKRKVLENFPNQSLPESEIEQAIKDVLDNF